MRNFQPEKRVSTEEIRAMRGMVMHYRYHHFHLPIVRFVSRLSPAARTAMLVAQLVLLGALLVFELSRGVF